MAQGHQKVNEYNYYSTIKVEKKKELKTYSKDNKIYVNSLDLADYLDLDNEDVKDLILICVESADYTLYDEDDNIIKQSTVIWIDKAESDYIINNFKNMGKCRI